MVTGNLICKSNNNSYHDDASAFFRCFFPKKIHILMPLRGITSSTIGLKIWTITAGIKTYKPMIKKVKQEAY